jgi:hypothetical protein
MKKIILTLATLFLLNACSKDDSSIAETPSSDNGPVLLRKIAEKNPNGGTITPGEITYDGTKIVQSTTGIYKSVYTYTGNLITKIQYYKAASSTTYQQTVYTYEGEKLKLATTTGITFGTPVSFTQKKEYTYNTDNSISYSDTTTYDSSSFGTIIFTGKLYYSNGNLIKKEIESGDTTSGLNKSIITYEYDTKNHPQKNILGFDKLFIDNISYTNNLLNSKAVSSTTLDNVTTNNGTTWQVYTYKYNDANYPTEQTSKFNGSLFSITTYTY